MLKHRRYYLPGKNLNNFWFGTLSKAWFHSCKVHVPTSHAKKIRQKGADFLGQGLLLSDVTKSILNDTLRHLLLIANSFCCYKFFLPFFFEDEPSDTIVDA
jgi:hypothetical protein